MLQDLLETIALLHENEPRLNAQWIMRLIHGRSSDRVTYTVSVLLICQGMRPPFKYLWSRLETYFPFETTESLTAKILLTSISGIQ